DGIGIPLGIGEAITRHLQVQLPDGTSAAGNISITVLADSDNVLREFSPVGNAEKNNAGTVFTQVTLAPYADLTVGNVRLQPAGGFQPGQTVSVDWTVTNQGAAAVVAPWSEKLELRNLT